MLYASEKALTPMCLLPDDSVRGSSLPLHSDKEEYIGKCCESGKDEPYFVSFADMSILDRVMFLFQQERQQNLTELCVTTGSL